MDKLATIQGVEGKGLEGRMHSAMLVGGFNIMRGIGGIQGNSMAGKREISCGQGNGVVIKVFSSLMSQ